MTYTIVGIVIRREEMVVASALSLARGRASVRITQGFILRSDDVEQARGDRAPPQLAGPESKAVVTPQHLRVAEPSLR